MHFVINAIHCRIVALTAAIVIIPTSIQANTKSDALQYLSSGDAARIKALAESGFDFQQKLDGGQTYLMRACQFSHSADIVRYLLAAKIDVNARDSEGKTALMYAAQNTYGKDQIAIVKILIENKADVNVTERTYGKSALFDATANGNIEVVKMLIAAKANVRAKDLSGEPILTAAVGYAHRSNTDDLPIIKLLVASGARINDQDSQGITPLMKAAEIGKHGEPEIVRFFIKNGAKVNARNRYGQTVLGYLDGVDAGTEGDHSEVISILKAAGAR
jgi:ankyrin repeat protein